MPIETLNRAAWGKIIWPPFYFSGHESMHQTSNKAHRQRFPRGFGKRPNKVGGGERILPGFIPSINSRRPETDGPNGPPQETLFPNQLNLC